MRWRSSCGDSRHEETFKNCVAPKQIVDIKGVVCSLQEGKKSFVIWQRILFGMAWQRWKELMAAATRSKVCYWHCTLKKGLESVNDKSSSFVCTASLRQNWRFIRRLTTFPSQKKNSKNISKARCCNVTSTSLGASNQVNDSYHRLTV